jgi:hypothetical protein
MQDGKCSRRSQTAADLFGHWICGAGMLEDPENCAIIKIYADRFLSDASNDGTMRFGQSRRGLSASAGLKGAIECSSS